MNRSPSHCTLFLALLCFAAGGCGEERPPGASPSLEPPTSCTTLTERLDRPPLTGGTFHCLGCSRQWSWRTDGTLETLWFVVGLRCERLGSDAKLRIVDPPGRTIWQHAVEEGDSEAYCIREDRPPEGAYTIVLHGQGALPSGNDLIREFQGQVLLKAFDDGGRVVMPLLPSHRVLHHVQGGGSR